MQAGGIVLQQRAAQVGDTDNMQQGCSETQQSQHGAVPWLKGGATGNHMPPRQPPEQYEELKQQHNRLQGQYNQLLQQHGSLQEKHRALTGEYVALDKQRGKEVAVEVHPRVVKLKSRILALEGGLQSQQEVIAILRSQLRAHGVPEPAETTDVTCAGKRARAADDNNDSSGHAFKRQSTQAMMGAAADAGPAAACDTAAAAAAAAAAAENTGLAAATAGDGVWDASAQKGNAEQVSGAAHQCVKGMPVADSDACSSDMAISASTEQQANTHLDEVTSASASPSVAAQPMVGNNVQGVLQQLQAVEKALAISKGNQIVRAALEALAAAPAFSASTIQLSQQLCKDGQKKKYRKNGRMKTLTVQLLETGLVVEAAVVVPMLGREKRLQLDTRALLAMFNRLEPGQDLAVDGAVKDDRQSAQPRSGVVDSNAAAATGTTNVPAWH